MSNILVYALHHEGAFNKNSLGAVSEAARLAGDPAGPDAPVSQPAEELVAERVAPDGGDEPGMAAELAEVVGDVERRATRIEGVGQEIPEDFAETDDVGGRLSHARAGRGRPRPPGRP